MTAGQDCILTTYPLSRGFAERLAGITSPDRQSLQLTVLRAMSVPRMLSSLRSVVAERVLVPFEDENSQAVLPVLKLIASVIPAKSYVVVGPNLDCAEFNRIDAAVSAFDLALASLEGARAVSRSRREVQRLLAADRAQPKAFSSGAALFLNANLWFGVQAGGSVGHISGVVNGLIGEGYDVTFASAGGRLQIDEAARYVRLDAPRSFGLPWERNYYRFNGRVTRQLTPMIAPLAPAFIYQRLSLANYSGVVLSRDSGLPLIMEYNGSEAWVARNWGRPLREQALAEQVEAANLKHAHLVVTISDVLRDELLERGVPRERIVSYPNCIDPRIFDPDRFPKAAAEALRSRFGIEPDAKVVTFVGTFGQWHGAEVLAQAVRALLDANDAAVMAQKPHFLFVGDGLKMQDVKAALGLYIGGGRVTLAGLVPQAEAPLYLAASDILASPHVPNADGSRFFGSPTKLFEYMAMERAIIASDLDQIGDVLAGSIRTRALPDGAPGPGQTAPALLCRPGDAADLARGLTFLLQRADWRARLGANARARALERYTWRHHVRAILDGAVANGLISGGDPAKRTAAVEHASAGV